MKLMLGDTVVDVITGFKGVLSAKCEYINGCIQFCVQPPAQKGNMIDGQYIDYKRLKIVGKRIVLPVEDTGGVMSDAPGSYNP